MSVQFFLSEEGITASVNGGPEKVVLRVGISEDANLHRSMILENEAGDQIFKYDEANGNVHFPWLVGGADAETDFSGYGAGGFRLSADGEDLDVPLNPGAGDPGDWNTGNAIAASIQTAVRAAAAPGGQFENIVIIYGSGTYKIYGSKMEINTISSIATNEVGEDFANKMKLQDPDYLFSMPGASQFQELRAGVFQIFSSLYRSLGTKFGADRDSEKIWFVDVENGDDNRWDSGSMYTPFETIQACFDKIAADGMVNDIVCILGGHYSERVTFDFSALGGITVLGVNCDGRDVLIGADSDPGNQAFTVQGTQTNSRETYFKNIRFINNHGDPGTDAFFWNAAMPNADVMFLDCYFENTSGSLGTAHAFNFQDGGELEIGVYFTRCQCDGPMTLHQDAGGGGELEFFFKGGEFGWCSMEEDMRTGGMVAITGDVDFNSIDYNALNLAQTVPIGGVHPVHFSTSTLTVVEDTEIIIRLARLIPIAGDASLLPTTYVTRTIGVADGRYSGEYIYLAHAGGDPVHFEAATDGMNVYDQNGEDVVLDGNMLGLMWVSDGESGAWQVVFDSKKHGTGPRLMAKVTGIDLTTPGTTFVFQTDSTKKWIKHHAVLVIEEADGANGDAEVRCGYVPNNSEVFGDTILAMTDVDDTWFWQLAPVIAQGGGRKLVVGDDYFAAGTDIQFQVTSGDSTAVTLTATLYLFGEYVDQALMPV